MSDLLSISGARIFDGHEWHEGAALLIEFGYVCSIVADEAIPANARRIVLDGGMIVPGFIDLQVNGGGGVQFNNDPSVEAVRTICAAHAQFGTTGLLPTLITDDVETGSTAIAAGIAAQQQRVPGFLGLHLEGPHLSPARKGAHDASLIQPMVERDLAGLIEAAQSLPLLLCTVAPEAVSNQQITKLVEAGAVISLGHSDASWAEVNAAFAAGASMVTHLFNAMSQLTSREPGLVGAALQSGTVSAGLIADGIHVHPATISAALKAKTGPGRIFLVTDAMAPLGTNASAFTLNGRTITRADGALRLDDGTLAGADLDMISAINFMISEVGVSAEEAFRMASLYPARAMGIDDHLGHLRPQAVASFVHLSDARQVRATWIAGEEAWRAP